MAADQDDAFYGYENVGIAPLTESGDAAFHGYENVGVAVLTESRDGSFHGFENVGVLPPPSATVEVPQIGWGTPIRPGERVTAFPQDQVAVADGYENVTE